MEDSPRPLLRGVFHLYAFYAAVAAGIVLVVLADGLREQLASWVYGVALAAMFGASALYHRCPWRSAGVLAWLRRLDHSTIFLFIAGTYTPFALVAFHGTIGVAVLVAVWAGAAVGLLLNLAWIDAPKWLAALVYLALGWVAIFTLPQLFSDVGTASAVLVIVGGGLYTLGAFTYAFRWPDPLPRIFGFHELFHLLVVAAAVVQYVAVSRVLLPS